MDMREEQMTERRAGSPVHLDLKALVEAYERSLIQEALEAAGGHQRRTAARLGILPTTLHEKMKRLGLLRRRARPESVEPLDATWSFY
jgi:DNA-binding NtrC family response regulator